MTRRIFVGDIQGCLRELEELLAAVAFDPRRDELHPVGDLVNRGPDNVGVLRLLRELGAGGVLGNHDLNLLASITGKRPPRPRDTTHDVMACHDRDELVAWLSGRPFIRTWPDLLLVHAGLHPRWDDPQALLGGESPDAPSRHARFATTVRRCDAAGNLQPGEEERARYRPWFEYYEPAAHGDKRVVFGHWAQLGLVLRAGVRGIDTGCVWGGQLTAWIAEEDRIVQVAAKRQYCELVAD